MEEDIIIASLSGIIGKEVYFQQKMIYTRKLVIVPAEDRVYIIHVQAYSKKTRDIQKSWLNIFPINTKICTHLVLNYASLPHWNMFIILASE